jgi:serine/threonine protein kinase
VARYVIEEIIGLGGLGWVCRARDEALGRTVALKLTPHDPESHDRFVREARAVAGLDHPNVLPVYAAGEAGGYDYLAMRLVVAGSLADIIRREGPLSPDRAMRYLVPVASALDAAHRAGLVHRNVKPANILVDAQPGQPEHVYLSDFSLATPSQAGTGLTRTGTFVGTPGYASPEQIKGEPEDGRADQYSLACLTDELLTGSVPFTGDYPMAVLYAHLYQVPPRLSERRPELRYDADAVLAKALAKAPGDRFESCDAFAAALSRALSVGRRTVPWMDDADFELPEFWQGRGPGVSGSAGVPGPTGSGGSSEPPSSGSGNGGSPPKRYLRCRCQDIVPVGKPFSLIASIAVDGVKSVRTGLLPPFDGPADVTLVLHAPGLRLLGDQSLTVRVPADGDSSPVLFELRADAAGPRTVSVTAWLGGSYLGEQLISVTAERDHALGLHREFITEIDAAPGEGVVSLVVRHDQELNAYRFEFRDEDNPGEVMSRLSFEPRRRIERLVADLDRMAATGGGYSAGEAREYLVNAGAELWRELVPPELRDQFWERQHRIRQLTILTDGDTVPWELLYPRDPGHDEGFLVQQFPVTRAVFGRRPARELRLSPARFVLPRGWSTPAAEAEVEAVRRLLDPARLPGAVVSELTPLQDLIRAGGFGLLHFACHNSFDPDGDAAILLGSARFTPTFLSTAVIDKVLARSAPVIFMNACRSAGLAPTYNRLDGWASRFLEAGAGAFIGSQWAVPDKTACEFAEELYGQLTAGASLGEAVMTARARAAIHADDPTWLAYSVYGDSRAKVTPLIR